MLNGLAMWRAWPASIFGAAAGGAFFSRPALGPTLRRNVLMTGSPVVSARRSRRSLTSGVAAVCCCLLLMIASAAPVATQGRVETYEAAVVDLQGRLVITTTDKRQIVIAPEGKERAFRDPKLSPGRTAVGVEAMFENCCTSYDIPLELLVYKAGRARRFPDGVIRDWHFVDESRVAVGGSTVHAECILGWELHDIETMKTLDVVNSDETCREHPRPTPTENLPAWVTPPPQP